MGIGTVVLAIGALLAALAEPAAQDALGPLVRALGDLAARALIVLLLPLALLAGWLTEVIRGLLAGRALPVLQVDQSALDRARADEAANLQAIEALRPFVAGAVEILLALVAIAFGLLLVERMLRERRAGLPPGATLERECVEGIDLGAMLGALRGPRRAPRHPTTAARPPRRGSCTGVSSRSPSAGSAGAPRPTRRSTRRADHRRRAPALSPRAAFSASATPSARRRPPSRRGAHIFAARGRTAAVSGRGRAWPGHGWSRSSDRPPPEERAGAPARRRPSAARSSRQFADRLPRPGRRHRKGDRRAPPRPTIFDVADPGEPYDAARYQRRRARARGHRAQPRRARRAARASTCALLDGLALALPRDPALRAARRRKPPPGRRGGPRAARRADPAAPRSWTRGTSAVRSAAQVTLLAGPWSALRQRDPNIAAAWLGLAPHEPGRRGDRTASAADGGGRRPRRSRAGARLDPRLPSFSAHGYVRWAAHLRGEPT